MKRQYIVLIITPLILITVMALYRGVQNEPVSTSVLSAGVIFSERILIPAATSTPSLASTTKIAFKSTPFPIEEKKPAPRKISSVGNPKVTFDSVYAILTKIARCESNNDPLAKNKSSSAKGLLQIIDGTWQSFKCDGHVLNAEDNMNCGVKIATQSGLHHWNESRSCWIKLVQNDVHADNRGEL